MALRRLLLHEVLCDLLGSRNVYFQPPASIKMNYPAIVYDIAVIDNGHANNGVYFSNTGYSVTVIDPNPDSQIVGKVASMPTSKFNRSYKKDNLNHSVFSLYF